MVYPKDFGYGSVFEDAHKYFTVTPELEAEAKATTSRIIRMKGSGRDEAAIANMQDKLKQTKADIEDMRLARLQRLENVSDKLIALCEGDNWQETQQLSAKFLGTLLLLTRGTEGNFASLHQRFKPLYKAVLTLRLADRLLEHDTIGHNYLSKYRDSLSRFRGNRYWREKWRLELGIPLISAAILQDIGLQSPAALTLLKGENQQLDEFRLLDEGQRKDLLKLNYHFTMKYVSEGLGIPAYVGNVREERDRFIQTHEEVSRFLQALVKDAFISKSGLGEILKIPQIYVSIVLSTKSDYSRKSLPKGYLLIEQLAKKGALNKKLAKDFIGLVGYFPQGFGITFIPLNDNGEEKKQYECAIVTELNPKNPAEPMCKVVTRNQKYTTNGGFDIVTKSSNLYFPANRKKLMRMGEKRLNEIMSQLSGNFSADAVENLVPSFWEPHDYFSYKKHQNLWSKK
ncbi:hypothetical protein [Alteromonas profundi]|nr:hypothetical protein [Alteromonas profundi]